MSVYTNCPAHSGHQFHKTTGMCSCGSNHRRWASPNNPDGYGVARVATFGPWADHATGCRCTVCK